MQIAFIHPHCDNINVGSYRLQTLRPVEWLRAQGVSAQIFKTVEEAERAQKKLLVVMQPTDLPRAVQYKYRSPDVKIVLFQSDGPLPQRQDLGRVDGAVVDDPIVCSRLPATYSAWSATWQLVSHIPTPLEIDKAKFTPHKHPRRSLRIVYLGAQGNYFFAKDVIGYLRGLRYSVTILSDGPFADIPWNVETYAHELSKFDVGIVPYPYNLQVVNDYSFSGFLYKDPSRPTLLQGIGLPVIVSPLPSYVSYIRHGENGLIANGTEQWVDCIEFLQKDVRAYDDIAYLGYKESWRRNSLQKVGEAWLGLLTAVARRSVKNVAS